MMHRSVYVALAIPLLLAPPAWGQQVDLTKEAAAKPSLDGVVEFLKKIAQGNAAETNVKSATLDKKTGAVHITFSVRHRHRPVKPVVLYDHTSEGEIDYNLDKKAGTIKVGAVKLDIAEFGKVQVKDVVSFLAMALGKDIPGPILKLIGDLKIDIKVDEFEKFKKALEGFDAVRKK